LHKVAFFAVRQVLQSSLFSK